MTTRPGRRWTRWHSGDWMSMVDVDADGAYTWGAWIGHSDDPPAGVMREARSLVDGQHQASHFIREEGHWCTDRCSFWIADPPIEE